jgi:hypothetical protein
MCWWLVHSKDINWSIYELAAGEALIGSRIQNAMVSDLLHRKGRQQRPDLDKKFWILNPWRQENCEASTAMPSQAGKTQVRANLVNETSQQQTYYS